ncbi:MAG: hypothetical protein ACI897_000150, partial [Flavobacteriales bacterium]
SYRRRDFSSLFNLIPIPVKLTALDTMAVAI